MQQFILSAMFFLLMVARVEGQTTRHVDVTNCPGPGTGTLGDPFCSIQDGINAALAGDEVLVAPGTYNELINFLGKAITVRSSGGRDVTTIDAGPVADPGTGKPVVRCDSGEGLATVLDGFTLTGGTGDSTLVVVRLFGGGMFINFSSPTVTNCRFFGNIVSGGGGGMHINFGSPTITNCIFDTNTSNGVDGGGGIETNAAGNLILTDCTFTNNVASVSTGGGLLLINSNVNTDVVTVSGCTFVLNTSTGGGGISNNNSSTIVTNCSFTENAAGGGGGMLALTTPLRPLWAVRSYGTQQQTAVAG